MASSGQQPAFTSSLATQMQEEPGVSEAIARDMEKLSCKLQKLLDVAHAIADQLSGGTLKKYNQLIKKEWPYYRNGKGTVRQTQEERDEENARKRGNRTTGQQRRNRPAPAENEDSEPTDNSAEIAELTRQYKHKLQEQQRLLAESDRTRHILTGKLQTERNYKAAAAKRNRELEEQLITQQKRLEEMTTFIKEQRLEDEFQRCSSEMAFGTVVQQGITEQSRQLAEVANTATEARVRKRLRRALGDNYDENLVENAIRQTRAQRATQAIEADPSQPSKGQRRR